MTPRIVESPAPPDGGTEGALVPDGHSPRKEAIAWLAKTVGLVAIGLASLLFGGIYRFGSAASALAYLRGDRLIPDTGIEIAIYQTRARSWRQDPRPGSTRRLPPGIAWRDPGSRSPSPSALP